MADSAPTIRSLAARLGLSAMTVSRALRGAHKVSASTRARVEEAAREMGYQVNPAVSTLMSSIRRRTVTTYRGKIAWLDTGHAPLDNSLYLWDRPIFEGCRQRSEAAGFLLESLWINNPALPPERLTAVMVARGIQGIIVTSSHPSLDCIDWNRFACATTQSTLRIPAMHVASNDNIHGISETLKNLRILGYRRIGLMLHAIHNQQRKQVDQALFLLENASQPRNNRIPVLLLPTNEEPLHLDLFGGWVERHHPDVVICQDEYVLDWARSLGIAVPGEIGLVHLCRHQYLTQWAGINQREEQIGAAAVDLVVGQLIRGEHGVPSFRKQVLIQGEWVTGSTVRTSAESRPVD